MIQKTKINIVGMHCKSCEMLVEEELLKVKGVRKVSVSQIKGCAEIEYKGKLKKDLISLAIQEAGYTIGTNESKTRKELPWLSKNSKDYINLALSLVIVLLAYFFLSYSKFELSVGNNFSSLPVVFLIGLTAGISTCMALVGGLVLGVSAKFAQKNPHARPAEKFKPHIFFNIGRIISFFVFGALAGLLGSFFTISISVTGILSIFAGIAMLFMGIQLIAISPKLSGISITIPKSLSKAIGFDTAKKAEYSNKNSLILGGLTFFLPCGFTQAVQLYAISTGNPITASLTLGVFALGTTPGLLGIAGLTSVVRGALGKAVFRITGVVVLLLSIVNISNGFNLSGINLSTFKLPTNEASAQNKKAEENIFSNKEKQIVKATYSVANDMQPGSFTFKAGQSIRLEVEALEDGYGCMGSLYIPGIMKKPVLFQKGKTEIVEFVAKPGRYTVACAMGVPRGVITVK